MPLPVHVAGGETILASWGNAVVDSLTPIGVVEMFAGDVAPTNWLLCRGQAVSRATYATLFTLIGTRFGTGDGTTTFNVPDMRGRYAVGYNQGGTYFTVGVGEKFGNKDAVVPAHQHGMENHYHSVDIWSGQEADAGAGRGWHTHYAQLGGVIRTNPFAPQYFMHVRTGGAPFAQEIPIDEVNSNSGGGNASTGEDVPHRHAINGNSGWATAHNTLWAGQDGTNGNLPPSVSMNYVIRVS